MLAKEYYNTDDEEREKEILEQMKNIHEQINTLRRQSDQLGKDARDADREERLRTMAKQIEGETYLTESLREQNEIIKERTKLVNELNKNPTNTTARERLDELEKDWQHIQENIEAYKEYATAKQNAQMEANNNAYAANQLDTEKQTAIMVERLINLYKQLGDVYERMSKVDDSNPKKAMLGSQAKDIREKIDAILQLNGALAEYGNVSSAAANAEAREKFSSETSMVKELERQTKSLTEAVREYRQAKSNGNKEGMEYWQKEINTIQNTTKMYEDQAKTHSVDEKTQKAITNEVQKQKNIVADMDKDVKGHGNELTNILNRYLSIGIVMRELRKLWSEAIKYVSTYYDKMNEIRVVTGKTQQQADQLGNSLRKMASEYSVSSTEMAEGAVTFYRQGLSDSEVEDRLRTVTQFAKTANLSFAETSEIITAVVNSYREYVDAAGNVGVSSKQVSDIFTTLGNSAGTSATELGKAAQVVAAYGSSVGLSLEKLSAYIATLSESTRLAPETIGRSLQSIMSRMQNLKLKGYTDSEDGDNTSLNDVAKALNTINVSLMDSAGNWRNIDDVFDDIAAKWNTMTDKQQAFISTTIAGTRQKNYFTALMQDMAGAQRSAELYELALNSAGSTSKAFATWTESVAAAQNRLQIALQNTYSALNGEWIKDAYNFGASLVEGFNAATEASNGLNVKLGILIPSLIQVLKLINGGGIGNIGFTIAKAFSEHPIILFTVAVGGAIAALSALINVANPKNIDISGLMDDASKAVDRATDSVKSFNDEQAKIMSTNDQLESLRQEYIDLSTKTSQTADDQKRLLEIYDEIEKLAPGLIDSIGGMGDKYGYQKEVVEALNSELRDNIDLLREQQRV